MTLITDTSALNRVCEKLLKADFLTLDTEFHRESTYWPELCLAQIATDEEAWAIDALAEGIDLSPLFRILNDKTLLKVVHAGRQDIEIFLHLSGEVPAPIFDTQIAAMACGFGDSSSYETLVSTLAGKALDKHSRFTDWRQRPLTDRQIKYALDDVIHLRKVYKKISEKIETSGRYEWVSNEMSALMEPSTYITKPRDAWRRLRIRSTEPMFLQLVMNLAEWREIEAQSRNLARGRLIKDETLIAIAAHPPKTREQLAKIRGVSRGIAEGQAGKKIIKAVLKATSTPDDKLPPRPKIKRTSNSIHPMVSLLKVLLKANCEKHGVAQQLVASAADLEEIASGNQENISALSGWRYEVFGSDALKLIEGRMSLTARKGEGIVLIELP